MQVFPGARATDALARGRIVDGKACFLITAPLLLVVGLLRTHIDTQWESKLRIFREETVNFVALYLLSVNYASNSPGSGPKKDNEGKTSVLKSLLR